MRGPKDEGRVAFAFAVLAGVRVLLFAAAFPFFGNVDEQSHFDLVHKYARGHVPAAMEHWDEDAARTIVLYGTPEYFETPESRPAGKLPGPRPPESSADRAAVASEVASLIATENHESTQPPVYYMFAGAWYRLGSSLVTSGPSLLYWVRSLNVAVVAAITWLSYLAARSSFPNRPFLRLGVPFLIAFFPQDVFYSINNDVFLPLAGGFAFFGLLRLDRDDGKALVRHVVTGLAVAASVLVKLSSVAFVPVAATVVGRELLRRRGEERRAAFTRAAAFLAAAAVPIGAWCLRNVLFLGDITGSAKKAELLGWSVKPLAAIFDHPLFTLSGLATFWAQTSARFWRGELVWGLKPLASPGWDRFFGLTSLILLIAAALAPMTWRKDEDASARRAVRMSLALFVLSLAFLAAISVIYDFGDCFYPSRAMPYLTSGRLALGALIPFAVLYVYGLDVLLPARASLRVRWTILIVPVALMTFSTIARSRVVFESAYNWFHLP